MATTVMDRGRITRFVSDRGCGISKKVLKKAIQVLVYFNELVLLTSYHFVSKLVIYVTVTNCSVISDIVSCYVA